MTPFSRRARWIRPGGDESCAFWRGTGTAPDIEADLGYQSAAGVLSHARSRGGPRSRTKGEGVFLQFQTEANQILDRTRCGAETWLTTWSRIRKRRGTSTRGTNRQFPGLPSGSAQPSGVKILTATNLMLHSFSELLITAVALACGYPASSIGEVPCALDLGELCSNDPVCA